MLSALTKTITTISLHWCFSEQNQDFLFFCSCLSCGFTCKTTRNQQFYCSRCTEKQTSWNNPACRRKNVSCYSVVTEVFCCPQLQEWWLRIVLNSPIQYCKFWNKNHNPHTQRDYQWTSTFFSLICRVLILSDKSSYFTKRTMHVPSAIVTTVTYAHPHCTSIYWFAIHPLKFN